MTLHLAPIPATAGPVHTAPVKRSSAKVGSTLPARGKAVVITAAMLLNRSDDDPLKSHFTKWLAGRDATKRKAAEFLRLLPARS